jgi:hypothetical protein
LRSGEEVDAAGRLGIVAGAQGPVPVAQKAGPVPGETIGELFNLEKRHRVIHRIGELFELDERAGNGMVAANQRSLDSNR